MNIIVEDAINVNQYLWHMEPQGAVTNVVSLSAFWKKKMCS